MGKNRKLEFEEYIELCKEYKAVHGHVNIPLKYETENGIRLGNWVSYQRRWEDKLSNEHRKMLENIGFKFSANRTWNYLYDMAKKYKEQYGTINNVGTTEEYNGVKLGRWLAANRTKYNEGVLSVKRIRLLEDLDFNWKNNAEVRYELYLTLFKKYVKENGHLMPSADEEYNGVNIGQYVARLRKYYKQGKLSNNEIAELEDIGMKWDGRKAYWDSCYNLCLEYLNKGLGKITVRTEYKGYKIGAWIARQKQLYKYGSLDDEQIRLIEKLKEMNNQKYSDNVKVSDINIREGDIIE